MRIVYSIFLCCVGTLFYSTIGNSQDFVSDMKLVSETYQSGNEFYAEIAIDVQFTEKEELRPYKKAVIYKNGRKLYYSLDGSETVVTDTKLIVANNRIKKIIYRELKEKEQEALSKKYYQSGLDTIATNYDSVVYSGKESEKKHYIVYSAKKMISKTDIFIDANTNYLTKMVYHYNSKLAKEVISVRITFSYPKVTGENEASIVEENYLITKGKQCIPAKRYLNYELNKVDNE